MIYKVIHNNSAVNNKCKAVETLLTILIVIKKKIIKYKFASPINMRYTIRVVGNCLNVKSLQT